MKHLVLFLSFFFFTNVALAGNNDNDKTTSRVITGKVLSAEGESIAGAVITVKETGEQFFSDLDGNFKLVLPANQVYLLSIGTIGFQSKELKSNEVFSFGEHALEPLN